MKTRYRGSVNVLDMKISHFPLSLFLILSYFPSLSSKVRSLINNIIIFLDPELPFCFPLLSSLIPDATIFLFSVAIIALRDADAYSQWYWPLWSKDKDSELRTPRYHTRDTIDTLLSVFLV